MKKRTILLASILSLLSLAFFLVPRTSFLEPSFAAQATPGSHESKGLAKTFTWSAKSGSSVGNWSSGASVYPTDTAGASTYVTGYLYACEVISSTGASAFASGMSVYVLNSRGVDILGTDVGKTLNPAAGITTFRTPLTPDGAYRYLHNEPLEVRAYGCGTGRTFTVRLTVMD